jgi:hypothetical protein
MLRAVSLTVVLVAVVLATAGCGADASATFKADGSVTVGMKILFPKSLMQSSGGTSIGGFSQSDIASANKQLQQKYSGGTITVVTEGDESGAVITIPFKTERDAFAFLTQPPKMSPSSATSGSSVGLNLSNTGGMFSSATHTTSGATDTYRFVTVAQPQASPKSGQQQVITDDELQSIFTITFAITVPHVITSAPGALFTLDRKTAIWKLHWTRSETLTATTGADAGLTAGVLPLQDWRLLIAVAFVAVAGGFLGGMFIAWRGLTPRPAPTSPAPEVPPSAWP